MRILLDTNIILDMFQSRGFDEEGLRKLHIMRYFGDVEMWASAKSYPDVFYFLRKELGSERAQDVLAESLAWLKPCSVDEGDVSFALNEHWPDFEDCLVNACARKIKADYLVTRDKEGFGRSEIPHGSASEFMEFVFARTNIRYDVVDARGD